MLNVKENVLSQKKIEKGIWEIAGIVNKYPPIPLFPLYPKKD